MDFASDENKHKHISRDMMRMTNRINKQYFKEVKERGVRCFTCHRGEKEPKDPPKEVLENWYYPILKAGVTRTAYVT